MEVNCDDYMFQMALMSDKLPYSYIYVLPRRSGLTLNRTLEAWMLLGACNVRALVGLVGLVCLDGAHE